MATFLDIGLFQYFNVIFTILLIFIVVFALLQKTRILGKNVLLNAVLAIALAFLSLLYPDLIDLINFIAPWFVLVFIFVILLLLTYQILGATEQDIAGFLKKDKTIQWTVIGVALLILFAGIAHVWGAKVLPITQQPSGELPQGEGTETTPADASTAYQQNIMATFFNPKILGLILIFLVAIFAVAFLSGG